MSTFNSPASLAATLASLIHKNAALDTVFQVTADGLHADLSLFDSLRDSLRDASGETHLYILQGEPERLGTGKDRQSQWLHVQPQNGAGQKTVDTCETRSPTPSAIAPLLGTIEQEPEAQKALVSLNYLQLTSGMAIASFADALQSALQKCCSQLSDSCWDILPIALGERVVGLLALSRAAAKPLPESFRTRLDPVLVMVAIAIQNAELKQQIATLQHSDVESKECSENALNSQFPIASGDRHNPTETTVFDFARGDADSHSISGANISGAKYEKIQTLAQSLTDFELPATKYTTAPWFYTLLSATQYILWEEDINAVFTYLSPQVGAVLGYAPEEMVGRKPTDFMTDDEAKRVALMIHETNQHPRPLIRFENTLIHKNGYPVTLETSALPIFDTAGTLQGYRGIDVDVSDRKDVEAQLQKREQQLQLYTVCQFYSIAQQRKFENRLTRQTQQEQVARLVLRRIRQTLNLNSILSTAVQELRQLLDVDRVIIYQFLPDGSGIVNHESVAASKWSMLHQVIYDPCFNGNTATLYLQGKTSAIADVKTAELAPCYRELLEQCNVRSSLVIPIMKNVQVPVVGPTLWGLFIAHHCSEPRDWNASETELMSQISDELAIAIQQAELYAQLLNLNENLESQVAQRTQQISELLNFESLLRRVTTNIRDSLDEEQIIAAAVEALKVTLGGIRCNYAVYHEAEGISAVCYETTDEPPFLQGRVSAIADFDDLMPQLKAGECLQFCEPHARSSIPTWSTSAILACPIRDNQSILGDLWLFRPADQHFSDMEVQLAQQVADQCAIAIRQSRLFRAAQSQVKELQKLNALKDDFLSTVSHELRTPVASIKVAVDLLELSLTPLLEAQPHLPLTPLSAQNSNSLPSGSSPSGSKTTSSKTSELDLVPNLSRPASVETRIQQYLYILKHECKREISLIDDLLDLSRLDADTEPMFLSQMKLQDWIPYVAHLFDERLAQRQQSLTLDLPQDLPALTTDFAYFERVLSELLQNASKYTPSHEAIHVQVCLMPAAQAISAASHAERFQLKVSNSGVEIAPEECDRIFDKFYRIPNADPWKNPGTGLGLALVRKLVEILQGTIAVSTTPGWTHFTVDIPSLPQSALQSAPQSASL